MKLQSRTLNPDHIALDPLFFPLHVFSSVVLVHFVKFRGKHWQAGRKEERHFRYLKISLTQRFKSALQSGNFLMCYKSGCFFYPVT